MTSAFGPSPDEATQRANWLGRYLEVEKSYDAKLSAALKDAAASVDDAFGSLLKDNISTAVKKAQLGLAQSAIRKKITQLFSDTKGLIEEHQSDAAVAAVNADLYTQKGVLAKLFKNTSDRTQYADSLRQTAKRNVEAMMTRILHKNYPLAESVYGTTNLANGLVSQKINNGLAQGQTAKEMADAVKDLINPAVPGGVSYAAKRLGRTEINNAFHAQSIADAQETPWTKEMEWHLSKTHVEDPGDECETYAHEKDFAVDKVPDKPHPNCRCYVTPVSEDYASFEDALIAGKYDDFIQSKMAPTKSAPEAPAPVATATPVRWTGPKVVKPVEDTYTKKSDADIKTTMEDIDNSAVVEDIQAVWTSTEFDEFKTPMRKGARIAQAQGYSGMDAKTREHIRELQEDTSSYSGPDKSDRPDALLEQYGKELVAEAVHAEPTTESFWRGMQLTTADANKLVEGQNLSLPLSSFSDDPEFAEGFATGTNDWESSDVPRKDSNPVLLELLPGAKAAPMIGGERIPFGQFHVVSVEDDAQAGVKRVAIQQHSMIEAAVKDEGRKETAEDIPEIEFVGKPEAADLAPLVEGRPKAPLAKNAAILKHIEEHVMPNARILGFDDPMLDPVVAQHFSDALEDMRDRYPAVKITDIGFGDIGASNGLATDTGRPKALERTNGFSTKIQLSDLNAINYESWQRRNAQSVKTGWFWHGADKDPVQKTLYHEYGHAIDYMLESKESKLTTDQIANALFEHYDSMKGAVKTGDALSSWVSDQFSGYSFLDKEKQDMNRDELIAEAFEAVERLGKKASDGQKIVHKLLIDRYNEYYGDY